MNRQVFAWLYAVGLGSVAFAGELTPPPGPVTATMKTLVEVEPRVAVNADNTPGDADSVFRIAQAGSYYLTENVVGEVGRHGVEIGASDVTLDLNGFAVIGVAGSLDGVLNNSGGSASVYNGRVRGFGGDGVDLNTIGSVARDLVLSNNGGAGLRMGSMSVVRDVSSRFNGGDGIRVGSGSVSGCLSESNGGAGISVSTPTSVVDCQASGNADDDFQGTQDVVFERCVSLGGMARGFDVGIDSIVRDCVASFSGLDGIRAGARSLVESCVVSGSNGSGDPLVASAGIDAGADSIIRNSVSSGALMSGRGIILRGSGLIEGCVTRNNESIGISAFSGEPAMSAVVTGCVSEGNGIAGIRISGGAVVDCSSSENDGEGIRVDGESGIVERSRALNNTGNGILITGLGGIVRSSTASGNGAHGIVFQADIARGGLIVDCTANGNTFDGIGAFDGSIVRDCTARQNGRFGIIVTDGARVEGCAVSENTQSGIFALSRSAVVNNTCTNNAAGLGIPEANISVGLGGGSRVEGNTVSGGNFGILGLNGGNLVVGNRVTGCAIPYAVTGAFGPVIDVSAGGNISGVAGSDHPMANFVY